MSLTIIKEGNKNFQHQDVDYADYGANDITIIFDGDTVKLRSVSGRIVFDKDGYNYSDVTIIDNSTGGGAEVFPNIISLKQRLINLGYPFGGGSDEVVLNSVDWGNINGNIEVQGDLITKFNTKQDTLVSGTNIKTVNGETLLGSGDLTLDLGLVDSVVAGDNITVDNTDPANPIITGENGGVQSVTGSTNIDVDNTDPNNPVVSLIGIIDAGTITISTTNIFNTVFNTKFG